MDSFVGEVEKLVPRVREREKVFQYVMLLWIRSTTIDMIFVAIYPDLLMVDVAHLGNPTIPKSSRC